MLNDFLTQVCTQNPSDSLGEAQGLWTSLEAVMQPKLEGNNGENFLNELLASDAGLLNQIQLIRSLLTETSKQSITQLDMAYSNTDTLGYVLNPSLRDELKKEKNELDRGQSPLSAQRGSPINESTPLITQTPPRQGGGEVRSPQSFSKVLLRTPIHTPTRPSNKYISISKSADKRALHDSRLAELERQLKSIADAEQSFSAILSKQDECIQEYLGSWMMKRREEKREFPLKTVSHLVLCLVQDALVRIYQLAEKAAIHHFRDDKEKQWGKKFKESLIKAFSDDSRLVQSKTTVAQSSSSVESFIESLNTGIKFQLKGQLNEKVLSRVPSVTGELETVSSDVNLSDKQSFAPEYLIKSFMVHLADVLETYVKHDERMQENDVKTKRKKEGFERAINWLKNSENVPQSFGAIYHTQMREEQPNTVLQILNIQRGPVAPQTFFKTFFKAATAFLRENPASLMRQYVLLHWMLEEGEEWENADKPRLEEHLKNIACMIKELRVVMKELHQGLRQSTRIRELIDLGNHHPYAATLIRVLLIIYIDKFSERDFLSLSPSQKGWISSLSAEQLKANVLPKSQKKYLTTVAGYIINRDPAVKKLGFGPWITAILEIAAFQATQSDMRLLTHDKKMNALVSHIGYCVENYFSQSGSEPSEAPFVILSQSLDERDHLLVHTDTSSMSELDLSQLRLTSTVKKVMGKWSHKSPQLRLTTNLPAYLQMPLAWGVSGDNPITLKTLAMITAADKNDLELWKNSLEKEWRQKPSTIGKFNIDLISVILEKNLQRDPTYRYCSDILEFLRLDDSIPHGADIDMVREHARITRRERMHYYLAILELVNLLCRYLSAEYRNEYGGNRKLSENLIKLCTISDHVIRGLPFRIQVEVLWDQDWYESKKLQYPSAEQVERENHFHRNIELIKKFEKILTPGKVDNAEGAMLSTEKQRSIEQLNEEVYGFNPRGKKFRVKFNEAKQKKNVVFFIDMLFTPQYHPIAVTSNNPEDETISKLCREVADVFDAEETVTRYMWLALSDENEEKDFYHQGKAIIALGKHYLDNSNLDAAKKIAIFGLEHESYQEDRSEFASLLLCVLVKLSNIAWEEIGRLTDLDKHCFKKALKLLLDPCHILSVEELKSVLEKEKSGDKVNNRLERILNGINDDTIREDGDLLYIKAVQQDAIYSREENSVRPTLLGRDIGLQRSVKQAEDFRQDAQYEVAQDESSYQSGIKLLVLDDIEAPGSLPSTPTIKGSTAEEIQKTFHRLLNEILAGLVDGAFPEHHPTSGNSLLYFKHGCRYKKDIVERKRLKEMLWKEIQLLLNQNSKPDSSALYTAFENVHQQVDAKEVCIKSDGSIQFLIPGIQRTDLSLVQSTEPVFFNKQTLPNVLDYLTRAFSHVEEQSRRLSSRQSVSILEATSLLRASVGQSSNQLANAINATIQWLESTDDTPSEINGEIADIPSDFQLAIQQVIVTRTLTNKEVNEFRAKVKAPIHENSFIKRLRLLQQKEYTKCLENVCRSNELAQFIDELKQYIIKGNNAAERRKRQRYLDDFVVVVAEDAVHNPERKNNLPGLEEQDFDWVTLVVLGFQRFVRMETNVRHKEAPKLLQTIAKLAQEGFNGCVPEEDKRQIQQALNADKEHKNNNALNAYYTHRGGEGRLNYVAYKSKAAIDILYDLFISKDIDLNDNAMTLYYHIYTLAQASIYPCALQEEESRFDKTHSDSEMLDRGDDASLDAIPFVSKKLLNILHEFLCDKEKEFFSEWHRGMVDLSKKDPSSLHVLVRRMPAESKDIQRWVEGNKSKSLSVPGQLIGNQPTFWQGYYEGKGSIEHQFNFEAHAIFELSRLLKIESLQLENMEFNTVYQAKSGQLVKHTQQNSVLEQIALIFTALKWWYNPKTTPQKVKRRSPFAPALIALGGCDEEYPVDAVIAKLLEKACHSFNEIISLDNQSQRFQIKDADDNLLFEEIKTVIKEVPEVLTGYIKYTLAAEIKSIAQSDFILSILRVDAPLKEEAKSHAGQEQWISNPLQPRPVDMMGARNENERSLLIKVFHYRYNYIDQMPGADVKLRSLKEFLKLVEEYRLWQDYYAYIADSKSLPNCFSTRVNNQDAEFLARYAIKIMDCLEKHKCVNKDVRNKVLSQVLENKKCAVENSGGMIKIMPGKENREFRFAHYSEKCKKILCEEDKQLEDEQQFLRYIDEILGEIYLGNPNQDDALQKPQSSGDALYSAGKTVDKEAPNEGPRKDGENWYQYWSSFFSKPNSQQKLNSSPKNARSIVMI